MDFNEAFTHPFTDPNWWKKFLVTGLISFIPIIGMCYFQGWEIAIIQRALNDPNFIYPKINFGDFVIQGIKAWIIRLFYCLPIVIFYPIFMIVDLIYIHSNQNQLITILMLITGCLLPFVILMGVVMTFFLPAAEVNFAVQGDFLAGFRFNQIFKLVHAAPMDYFLVYAGSIILAMVNNLGWIACGVGLLLTAPYSTATLSHLYAKAYQEARRKQGNPTV
jgi:hypothetical protein